MAEPDKQYTGDGHDNYADAARKAAEALKQAGSAAAEGSAAGAEATTAASAGAATAAAGSSGAAAATEVAAGAAAGGPWGAVIAAAWALRHTLFKILVFSCLGLMFLITFIVSLPSILFDQAFQNEADPSVPTGLLAVYEELSASVTACVASGYEYAKSEVERIISEGGYDRELSVAATIDNAMESAELDVCYILAAYSVSMEQQGTTKADMEAKLNAAVAQMYPVTYEVKRETVTVPAEAEGGEDTEETIEYVVCTIHPFDSSVILTAFGIDINASYGDFGISTGAALDNMATALKNTVFGVTGGVNNTHALIVELTAEDNTPFSGGSFTSPVAGWEGLVSSEFGTGYVGHTGLDMAVPAGTEVRAAASGRVLIARTGYTGYGFYVVIYHGGGMATLYAHNSQLLVSEGQTVSRGDVIALSGSTGRSTGPHVHFEVIADGVPENPRLHL